MGDQDMFKKILIANRGVRAEGAGVCLFAPQAQVSITPNCLVRAAHAGDLVPMEARHV
jgi:hypothetical protein